MSDTQVIKGVELPKFMEEIAVYPYGATREDGTQHESKRILVEVKRKKGEIILSAFVAKNHRGTFIVRLPLWSRGKVRMMKDATLFAFALNQALKSAVEVLRAEF